MASVVTNKCVLGRPQIGIVDAHEQALGSEKALADIGAIGFKDCSPGRLCRRESILSYGIGKLPLAPGDGIALDIEWHVGRPCDDSNRKVHAKRKAIVVSMDGFLGDEGPWSFYNVMRGMTILGTFGSLLIAWSLTPWFPWK